MAELSVEISAKIDRLLSELGKAKKALGGIGAAAEKLTDKLKRVGEKMGRIGKSMATYLTLPLLAIGGAAIKMSSDFTESLNKVDVAFKSSSKEVRKFAKTTLETFGIAEGTALDMAALFGDMGTSMGIPTDKAAILATSLVGLAGDMSSFKNINIKEVTTALNGVFTGETESLKRMGIVMTIANLKAYALSKGISGNIEAMTQAQKVQLRYAYILSITKNAQGDFARTSDGSANQMRIFTESVKELSVAFGEILLPYFTKAITYVNKLVKAFTNLSPTTKKIIVVVAALVAVVGPLLIGLGFLSTTIIPALITGFTILTGPIGLTIAAIAALGVIVYKSFDAIIVKVAEFYNSFVDVYNQSALLRGIIAAIGLQFKNVWTLAKFAFKSIWAYMKSFGSNVINLFKNIGKVITGVLGLNPAKISEGIIGAKDIITKGLSNIGKEVSKYAKEAGDEIGVNIAKALDETVNGELKHKTPQEIKKSLTSLGNSLKETAKEVGNSIGISLADGVTEGSTNGRSKTVGLNLDGLSSGVNSEPLSLPMMPLIDTEQFDMQAALMREKAQQFSDGVSNILQNGVLSTFEQLGNNIGMALANGGNVIQAFMGTILSAMGSTLQKYGSLVVAAGIASEAFSKSMKNPFGGGIGAIIAGTALIAIGGAVKSFSGGLGKGSSSGGSSSRGSGASDFSGSSSGGNFGASSGSSGLQNVVFEIQGTKLVGVLSNTLSRNRSLGGSLSLT